jgi:hypothetical protein
LKNRTAFENVLQIAEGNYVAPKELDQVFYMERQRTLRTLDIIEQLGFHLISHFVRCSLGTMYFFHLNPHILRNVHLCYFEFICNNTSETTLFCVCLHKDKCSVFWGRMNELHLEECSPGTM